MILLILVLITLYNYSCYAALNKVENVYIDTLVRQYLEEEKFLWDSIYANSSGDRSIRNVNTLLTNIESSHNRFLNDEYLDYVMSVTYMSKYTNYMDFYNMQHYAEEYQHRILTSPRSQQNSYMDVETTFSIYNYTQAEQLFRNIYEV